jgi:NTE family protein
MNTAMDTRNDLIVSPATWIAPDLGSAGPQNGKALCLSGGGYRAMLFHLGAIIRLNEAALLPHLKRISSVSGGSILAGVLATRWNSLTFHDGIAANLDTAVIDPIRLMASKTIDVPSILKGIFNPGSSISSYIIKAYDKWLFDGATLQDLPSDEEGPRFIFNATSLQSGALWRFSKLYMADYLVGRIPHPTLPVAAAVAASSAFPPVLSPVKLTLDPSQFIPDATCPLQRPPFTTTAIVADGGVYDNLGLETAWKQYKTILVSDGGAKMEPHGEPRHDWPRQAIRVLSVIDNQVRSLRVRQLIAAYKDTTDDHDGAYWGIRSHITSFGAPNSLDCPHEKTMKLAETATRLKGLSDQLQEKIINWGYAVSDAALRKHVDPALAAPSRFPYDIGVG